MSDTQNRYAQLIEYVFFQHYVKGSSIVSFQREALEKAAAKLTIALPKNLGDIIYSFRYRSPLPEAISKLAPKGMEWIIRASGKAKYDFCLTKISRLAPNPLLSEIKIPDGTPGVIERYAFSDEQGLLAKLRYNRLIDIFTGLTCYSLQNHLRTTVPKVGQIEIDELYIGIDKKGVHYIIPVQAKGGKDQLGTVQIEQDFMMCHHKFPTLFCCPVAAQFMDNDLIALFAFDIDDRDEIRVTIRDEKHYRLVNHHELSDDEIVEYRKMVEINQ